MSLKSDPKKVVQFEAKDKKVSDNGAQIGIICSCIVLLAMLATTIYIDLPYLYYTCMRWVVVATYLGLAWLLISQAKVMYPLVFSFRGGC